MSVKSAALADDDLRPETRKSPEFPAPGFLEDKCHQRSDNGDNIFSSAGGGQAPSSSPALRDYQIEAVARLEAAIGGDKRRILFVSPTGSGKTLVAGALIENAVRHGRQTLVLAHRREIIAQTSAKLFAAGVRHGIIQAGFPMRPRELVQLASIATLHSRALRRAVIELPPADLVVVDEAHHGRAPSYLALLKAYPESAILGMTATPCRGDGRGLGNVFDVLVEAPQVADLIAAGYLVGTRVYAPTRPDLKGVRIQAGDYVEGELARRMDTNRLVGDIVEHWHKLAERRRTVVFASGVQHSLHLRDEFLAAGVRAEHLDGSTPAPERDAILSRLAVGETEVVINCMVLTEGWDQPAVECLVLARPTRHMGLYRQMIGRGLRPSPGKADCLVLDHAGAVFEHGFVEDRVDWTLDVDRRAVAQAHRARAEGREPQISTCPQCFAVRRAGGPCIACGWRPTPKPVPVDVTDGELGRVDWITRAVEAERYGDDEKYLFHRELAAIAVERSYQPGWVAHKYRERFGHWPPTRFVEPIEPRPATRSWVKSRQIAYARAQERSAAQ
jgi:superfamily II DNA or RNA helicase